MEIRTEDAVPTFPFMSISAESNLISPVKVDIPETTIPPESTLIPDLAVINPIESTFVTSSYVIVPPTEMLPLIFVSPSI